VKQNLVSVLLPVECSFIPSQDEKLNSSLSLGLTFSLQTKSHEFEPKLLLRENAKKLELLTLKYNNILLENSSKVSSIRFCPT